MEFPETKDTRKPIYSMSQFEKDIESIRPRVFDTYILPGFMMVYAYRSKGMKRIARRMLFTSGIYMMYRNYSEYKKMYLILAEKFQPEKNNNDTTA